MQTALISTLTAIILLVIAKIADDWNERRKARRALDAGKGKEARDEEAEDINAARFWQGDALELRRQITQLRLDFKAERKELEDKIAALVETNERQAAEMLVLKGQIFDLLRDRTRQTQEGARQTREGDRQTREGERQTIEGDRLRGLRRDMADETKGDAP